MPAILIDNLSKIYHVHHKEPGLRGSLGSLIRRQTLSKRAVDGISFRIQPGEVVGFLGPNGAGKTTTLKMLSGLLYPTAGTATVLGHVPARREREYLRQIAFIQAADSRIATPLPSQSAQRFRQSSKCRRTRWRASWQTRFGAASGRLKSPLRALRPDFDFGARPLVFSDFFDFRARNSLRKSNRQPAKNRQYDDLREFYFRSWPSTSPT